MIPKHNASVSGCEGKKTVKWW